MQLGLYDCAWSMVDTFVTTFEILMEWSEFLRPPPQHLTRLEVSVCVSWTPWSDIWWRYFSKHISHWSSCHHHQNAFLSHQGFVIAIIHMSIPFVLVIPSMSEINGPSYSWQLRVNREMKLYRGQHDLEQYLINQTIQSLTNQSISQTADQSIHQSVNQSTNQSIINQSIIHQSSNQSITHHSINQSVNLSNNQSIIQPLACWKNLQYTKNDQCTF